MVKEIELTRGYVSLVDDEDYAGLAMHKWRAMIHRLTVYAVRSGPRGDEPRTTVYMHRVLLDAPRSAEVDHEDGNGLNNRRVNIRLCTIAENGRNMRKHRGVSRYKGVYWDKRDQRWVANIHVNRRHICLGLHVVELDAARAYDAAAREHYGAFAAVNFPEDGERGCL